MIYRRVHHYPARFVVRHPLRAARNVIGNHPSAHADRFLSGLRGIEIGGAANNDFFLDTINVDIKPTASTAAAQLAHAGHAMPIDVVAPADELPFADSSYDFVLASHVLEHVPDPIRALREWSRVATQVLYIVLPLPDNEFDIGRPLTTIDELEERHRAGFSSDDDRHWSVWSSDTFSLLCRHLGLGVVDVKDPDDKRGNGFATVVSTGQSSSSA